MARVLSKGKRARHCVVVNHDDSETEILETRIIKDIERTDYAALLTFLKDRPVIVTDYDNESSREGTVHVPGGEAGLKRAKQAIPEIRFRSSGRNRPSRVMQVLLPDTAVELCRFDHDPEDWTYGMPIPEMNKSAESAEHKDVQEEEEEEDSDSDDDDAPLVPRRGGGSSGGKAKASSGGKAGGVSPIERKLLTVNLRKTPAKLGERVPALPPAYISERTANYLHCKWKSAVAFNAVAGSLESACRDVSFNAVSGIWHAKNASILTVSMHPVSMGNQKYGSHYKDYVEKDGGFVWSGQNSNEDSAAHKLLFEKGRRVHLYLRRKKGNDEESLMFTYFGELQFVRRLSLDGAVPPRVKWTMKDFGTLKAMEGGLPEWAVEKD